MPIILSAGYEDTVRSRLGVSASELPDKDINDPLVIELAESVVIRRVPRYAEITDPVDSLHLKNAVISYICYLLCPTMGNRVKQEVSTIDVKWKKGKVDWEELAKKFLADFEEALLQIKSVEVNTPTSGPIFWVIAGGAFSSGR